jgi:hypothetical protein
MLYVRSRVWGVWYMVSGVGCRVEGVRCDMYAHYGGGE